MCLFWKETQQQKEEWKRKVKNRVDDAEETDENYIIQICDSIFQKKNNS